MGYFLKIPNVITRETDFKNWAGTAEFKIWNYLTTYIVRKPNGNAFTKLLYDRYFMNDILVARWNQETIAKNLGLKSKGYVSTILSSMTKKGIIKKHFEMWNGKKLCVYEFGIYDREKNENLYHAYSYFLKKEAAKKLIGFGISELVGFEKQNRSVSKNRTYKRIKDIRE